jgi:teichuronic acid biosynthesis glycosyltransferase TuaH
VIVIPTNNEGGTGKAPDTDGVQVVGVPMPLVKGRDVVIVSLQPWYFPIGCNAKNIAHEFARDNRVLYVNFPIKRKSFFARTIDPKIQKHVDIIKEKKETIYQIGSNLWEFYPTSLVESVNWLPFTSAFKIINYFNNARFARDIRKALSTLGFKDVILFNDNDIYNGFYLKELLAPAQYIYYFRDFLQGYSYWKKHTSVLEPELLRKSDLIVANSEYYAEYGSGYNDHSYYIGQGCDFRHFDYRRSFSFPSELSMIPSPRIGYVGALDSARLDLDLIHSIALADPTWNIVLVGPEDEVFRNSVLHDIPNIHFLGIKPIDLLPAFVKAFDVCINPQLKNQITKGNYPLKIDEYLAMGKPTVATRTKAMRIFEHQTYLADQPQDYASLIKKAMLENDPAREMDRIHFAHSHTWEQCMSELYKSMGSAAKEKQQHTL